MGLLELSDVCPNLLDSLLEPVESPLCLLGLHKDEQQLFVL
jgi:hypothetical protein